MIYALIKESQILRQQEFSESPPILSENKGVWLPVIGSPPTFDAETQKLEAGDFVINTGDVTRAYSVVELTETELLNKPYLDNPQITLTRRQFRLALFNLELLSTIESSLDGKFLIFYQDSQTFGNHHPLLIEMAQALGISAAQVLAVFTAGQALE